MSKALLIVDIQNDFVEGGALGISGGEDVANRVNQLVRGPDRYDLVVASRDWHDAEGGNGGHFAPAGMEPDFVSTWPVHCVRETEGAEYHPALAANRIDVHVKKGMGVAAYSAFEGETSCGRKLAEVLTEREISRLDIVGLATDHCVLRSGLDASRLGIEVRVLADYIAGVNPDTSEAALRALEEAGVEIVQTAREPSH